MKQEKSCGAICWKWENGQRVYLLILHRNGGHWAFAKGHVEGAETEALLGSRAIIQRDAPALLVSAYHRSADLFRLPLLVHELNPDYRLYLRRMVGVPAWDINLYAIQE